MFFVEKARKLLGPLVTITALDPFFSVKYLNSKISHFFFHLGLWIQGTSDIPFSQTMEISKPHAL